MGVVPVSELVKDAKGILTTTWIFAAVAALIALFIGLWIVRLVARPLTHLKDLMVEGAKGNLQIRTNYKAQDEIGQLSESFDTMMEQITLLVEQTNASAQEVLNTATELGDARRRQPFQPKKLQQQRKRLLMAPPVWQQRLNVAADLPGIYLSKWIRLWLPIMK